MRGVGVERSSFAPLGLGHFPLVPTAYAVGCISFAASRLGLNLAQSFPFNAGKGVGTIAASTLRIREVPCMEGTFKTMLRVGAWCVNPATGEISRNGETLRLEARAMLLLLCLAEHAGEVVSIEELLNQVWSGVTVSPDSVYQAVASLRRQLEDDPKQPSYIATVPRLGYRMVATVGPWAESGRRAVGIADVNSPNSHATNAREVGR